MLYNIITIQSIQHSPLGAGAGAVPRAARPPVLAPARLRAVQAEPPVRALLLALEGKKEYWSDLCWPRYKYRKRYRARLNGGG